MIKKLRKNQEGSVAALVAVMLAVLVGFLGLALDVANLVVIRTQMQNAVDAAVCAGCLQLSLPIPTGQTQAKTEANSILTANNFSPANATVTFTQDAVKNPSNVPEINCTLTNNVPTYFMKVFGITTVSMTAYAEAILESKLESYPGGPFNYTVFSNTNLTINGYETIQGSVHSNGNLTINGSGITITNAAEGAKGVTVNGTVNIGSVGADTLGDMTVNLSGGSIGSKYAGVTNIAMPDYTSQIKATATTTYNSSQTFNGNMSLTGNMYVNGSVTINGTITNTGCILATGSITINGTSTISGSNQVFLYSSGSSITINGQNGFGGGTSSVICYAPSSSGSITVNGVNIINGDIIGNSITINGGEDIDGMNNHNRIPITSVDFGHHAKLIS
jgi:cytoskeletal protein CcmA (bactofilin family)